MADQRPLGSPQAVAEAAADWIVAQLAARAGRLSVCLSGGSTPRNTYELLRAPDRRERLPWRRIHWFWGDERLVPLDDPQSNAGMAHRAFLDDLPAPRENIHAVPTHLASPEAVAAAYDRTLRDFHAGAEPGDRPLFDLVLLGLGTDGHTASLFPGSPALEEQTKWATATRAPDQRRRITLTPPALLSRAAAAVLVTGRDKRAMLAEVFAGAALPATLITAGAEVRWFVDDAARPPSSL